MAGTSADDQSILLKLVPRLFPPPSRTRSAEPIGGVEPASDRAAAAMAASRCGAAASAAISSASRRGVNSILHQPYGAAGFLQHAGIGELILIERMRQRHQDRGTADGRKLGDGRGAGAGDHEMAGRDARRQIGEERRDFAAASVCRRHSAPGPNLPRGLLHDGEPARVMSGVKQFDRGGNTRRP